MSGGITGMELAAAAVVGLVMGAFVVGGVLAYTGGWAPLRRAMVGDPEGHRMAGALWLGLLGLPVGVLVLTDPAPDGGLSPLHWLALVVMALLVVAAVVGTVRMGTGQASVLGTAVNLVWVAFDLAVLSVIIKAVRHRGPEELAEAAA